MANDKQAIRLRFWTLMHDWAETAWHWIYYNRIVPLTPKQPEREPHYYFLGKMEPTEAQKADGVTELHVYGGGR